MDFKELIKSMHEELGYEDIEAYFNDAMDEVKEEEVNNDIARNVAKAYDVSMLVRALGFKYDVPTDKTKDFMECVKEYINLWCDPMKPDIKDKENKKTMDEVTLEEFVRDLFS